MQPKTSAAAIESAYAIARRHNMFLVAQGSDYLLYRRTRTRPVFLGKRSDADSLRRLVTRCACTK